VKPLLEVVFRMSSVSLSLGIGLKGVVAEDSVLCGGSGV
jgi:hypothetical protein